MKVRHEKDKYKKFYNKADRLWKIFYIKHNSDKTPNKDGHQDKDISSNSDATNNLVNSSSYHRSIKSRARTKQNPILRKILPMDDPT